MAGDPVFKAYDVRGTVPDQINTELAYRVGRAFVAVLEQEGTVDKVVIGHDMRPSSPDLSEAFARGVNDAGASAVMIGLCSTDGLYFASGHLGLPGAMFTASHNPAQYNGIKLCRAYAVPVGSETGLDAIRDLVRGTSLEAHAPTLDDLAEIAPTVERIDLTDAYAEHLLSLAPIKGRSLKVVADAGNGMGGYTAPIVFAHVPSVELVPMYFELDGTFPNHEANPLDESTLVDLKARVLAEKADAGLAFDGDADRCFVVDEKGNTVNPSAITGLIASRALAKDPTATIIYNLITSRAVPQLVESRGGTAVRTRVGHSFIKQRMAETGATFGGEHSGHFYFRDFWRADSGMLAALHVLAALSETDKPLSELVAEFDKYPASGEINTEVADQAAILGVLRAELGEREGVTVDDLDGLTFEAATWRVNVRASNTEPLLRLNVEGDDQATMERLRDEALTIIRGTA